MEGRGKYFIAFILVVLIGCSSFFDRDEMALKQAVRWYDEALVKVYSRFDIKPLDGLTSERELIRVNMMLAKLDREKKTMDSELVEIKFVNISLEDDTKADVVTEEKWRYRYLRKGTKVVTKPWTEVAYRMKYEMVKSRGRWIVGVTKLDNEKNNLHP